MGWVEKVPYKHPHTYCAKPQWDKQFGVGSIWQCDNCSRKWRVKSIEQGDQRDGPYANWELYTPPSYNMYDR